MTRTTKRRTARQLRTIFLEAARRIAEGESRYITYSECCRSRSRSSLPDAHAYKALESLFGMSGAPFPDNIIFFDDNAPDTDTRGERVVFLCFAAAMLAGVP